MTIIAQGLFKINLAFTRHMGVEFGCNFWLMHLQAVHIAYWNESVWVCVCDKNACVRSSKWHIRECVRVCGYIVLCVSCVYVLNSFLSQVIFYSQVKILRRIFSVQFCWLLKQSLPNCKKENAFRQEYHEIHWKLFEG